jgi:hypothetical protein
MRRASVADTLAREDRLRDKLLSASERVMRALALGRRDLAIHAAASGLSPAAARRAVERRRQAGRRASGAVAALLA